MRFFKLIAFLLLVSLSVSAHDRSLDEMKSSAVKILNAYRTSSHRAKALSMDEVTELKRMDRLSIVGNKDIGFAVISHDDRFSAVLGYSLTELSDTLSCGFEWWLKAANESMKNPERITTRCSKAIRANSFPQSVPPLITTIWGQNEPFNNKCRVNIDGIEYPLLTGCVATAMAQILNYYKHPIKGNGSNSYKVTYTDWGEIEYSANFENSTYEWDNMIDNYGYSYTPAQADAVATLMRDCGIAVNMTYRTWASTAITYNVPIALKNNFSYELAEYHQRSNYSNEEWMYMLYDELSNGSPVLYEGVEPGESVGHAFVVHGYDSDGLVCVNWGWDGNEDGYFDIGLLNGYTENQGMVLINKTIPTSYTRSVVVSQPGYLSTLIAENEKNKIRKLKITGKINGTDILFIREMAGVGSNYNIQTGGKLSCLDLSDATIVTGGVPYYQNYTSKNNVLSKNMFFLLRNLETIILPKNLTAIEQEVFSGTKIRGVVIPSQVSGIHYRAFESCYDLIEVFVSSENKVYDSRNNCNAIINTQNNEIIIGTQGTTIPNSVTTIGKEAFCGHGRLSSITIPQSVVSICDGAFANCWELKTIICETKKPYGINDNVFYTFNDSIYRSATLYVPNGTKAKYQETSGWKNFANVQELSDNHNPTAIKAVESLKDDIPIYNLSGMKVNRPASGVCILRGKKVITQ